MTQLFLMVRVGLNIAAIAPKVSERLVPRQQTKEEFFYMRFALVSIAEAQSKTAQGS